MAVVGASLAGLRAAEGLRAAGFDGRLTLVGEEAHLPYDRPPLSKEVLRGEAGPESTRLRADDRLGALDLDLQLGRRAVGLDLSARAVALDNGDVLPFDGLVIATGAAPRRLPADPDLGGIYVLRTLDDALTLRGELEAGPRVAVVGAGFIGSEVAASCRQRGLDVTVIEALPVPLAQALGPAMGSALSRLHGDHSVDLRCGVGVTGFSGSGRVEQVRLSDGTAVAADVVVVGVGVAPATGWLEGSGLDLRDGVVCDAACRAAPGVVAAGDVARWPNPLFGEEMRVEHWDNAAQQGHHAAGALLAGEGAEPFAPVPYFWSDQYDAKIQFVGRTGEEVRVVHGAVEERSFVAVYGRDGRVVGALALSQPRLLMRYRALIAERAPLEAALTGA